MPFRLGWPAPCGERSVEVDNCSPLVDRHRPHLQQLEIQLCEGETRLSRVTVESAISARTERKTAGPRNEQAKMKAQAKNQAIANKAMTKIKKQSFTSYPRRVFARGVLSFAPRRKCEALASSSGIEKNGLTPLHSLHVSFKQNETPLIRLRQRLHLQKEHNIFRLFSYKMEV